MSNPFQFVFRVRYSECDAQKIVFNARWGDYIDLAATEYLRELFGSVDPEEMGLDWRLVRTLIEWKAPARFDEVLVASVRTVKIGTTSFTLAFEFRRRGEDAVLVTSETVYVVIDVHGGTKLPVPDRHRAALERGAPGKVANHAGV